jgi:hypothetical protein
MEDIRLPRHVIERLGAPLGEPLATGRPGAAKEASPPIARQVQTAVRGPSRSSSNALAEQTPGRPAHKREAEKNEKPRTSEIVRREVCRSRSPQGR